MESVSNVESTKASGIRAHNISPELMFLISYHNLIVEVVMSPKNFTFQRNAI